MKKVIPILMIIIIILNVFLPNYAIADVYDLTEKSNLQDMVIKKDDYEYDSENGSSDVNGNREGYNLTEGSINSLIKNFVKMINVIPTMAKLFMDVSVKDDKEPEGNEEYGEGFSIQKLVFNKIEIFDIDFFNKSEYDSDATTTLKSNISSIYSTMRNTAIVGLLVVLIYTGIKMAISSVAEKKAKYKQMLISWASAFIIIMILPYLMIAILEIANVVIKLFEDILVGLAGDYGDDVKTLEEQMIEKSTASGVLGFSIIIPTITYWIIVYYQVKFFIMYFKRIFSTAFLIAIGPLVLIQHAFDKVNTGNGGAFNNWLKEFALNIAMQPIHAVIYTVFLTIALNIMTTAPLLSVIFFATLSRAERVVRNLLSIKNSTTVTSMADNFKASDAIDKVKGMGNLFAGR